MIPKLKPRPNCDAWRLTARETLVKQKLMRLSQVSVGVFLYLLGAVA